jgi:hypothetical protein
MPVLTAAPWNQMNRLKASGVGRIQKTQFSADLLTKAVLAEPGARFEIEMSDNNSQAHNLKS